MGQKIPLVECIKKERSQMIQIYTDDNNKKKNYCTIPLNECVSESSAIVVANQVYFKTKRNMLECTKGFAHNGVLEINSGIKNEKLNVWVVARK